MNVMWWWWWWQMQNKPERDAVLEGGREAGCVPLPGLDASLCQSAIATC